METTLIRGFVLFLALTGFGASSVSSTGSASTHVHATALDTGGSPTPLCPPSSGQYCGMQ